MHTITASPLTGLYLSDEVAWLETMAALIAARDYSELDCDNLREFLTDMAQSQRNEVLSRLIVLIAHHLKWKYQPERRKSGWRCTIIEQRQQLIIVLKNKSLRNYAEDVIAEAYCFAVERAAAETRLPRAKFPAKSNLSANEWVALAVPE